MVSLFAISALKALRKGSKKMKKAIKTTAGWAASNWIPLLVTGVLIASSAFWYSRGRVAGSGECDAVWIKKYDSLVEDFNKRLEEAKRSSSAVADAMDEAGKEVNDDLDGIQNSLEGKARLQDKARSTSTNQAQSCTRPKAGLTDPLPQELFDAWAKMNEAGAQHDPYKDID